MSASQHWNCGIGRGWRNVTDAYSLIFPVYWKVMFIWVSKPKINNCNPFANYTMWSSRRCILQDDLSRWSFWVFIFSDSESTWFPRGIICKSRKEQENASAQLILFYDCSSALLLLLSQRCSLRLEGLIFKPLKFHFLTLVTRMCQNMSCQCLVQAGKHQKPPHQCIHESWNAGLQRALKFRRLLVPLFLSSVFQRVEGFYIYLSTYYLCHTLHSTCIWVTFG